MLAMENRPDGNPIVFVVDDDPEVREGLQALLASIGQQTLVFTSTADFLQRRPPAQVSCLILDVRLPGLGGLDLQAELVAANISIPIIFITGHADIPMTVKAMKAGAIEFLTKPFRDQDLLDAVRVALDKDRARSENDRKARELSRKFGALSAREREVMALVTAGLMNKQVAAQIGVSEVTVKVHRHNIMTKLGAKSLAHLVRISDSLGLPRQKAD
jgi:FixJ family two-component response regulator